MNPQEEFAAEVAAEIEQQSRDDTFRELSRAWMDRAQLRRYSYHFRWMGLPIIQYPSDIVAMQELIWRVRPDLIIETGIARGGSLVFYASMLELLGEGEVLGIDVDIRAHNREAIEAHPMSHRIRMIQGSSIDSGITAQAASAAQGKRVLVVLDSNHTHDHVCEELRLYAPLVSPGSYCVVMDTVVQEMPDSLFGDRPWGVGNNPRTAVIEFLQSSADFDVDVEMDHKLAVSVAPGGYLRRRS